LAVLLALLGFSATTTSCTKYGVRCNGISPHITGSVISEKDENPIEGIRAVLKHDMNEIGYDTAYTAANGDFFLQFPYRICKGEQIGLSVKLEDVDGNGVFEDMEIPIVAKLEQDLGKIRMTLTE